MLINKLLILLLSSLLLSADSLKELIEFAASNNDIVISKQYQEQSRSKEVESLKSSYFPTIDLGGLYKRDDEPSPFQAGDTYKANAKISLDVYDGGKRSSLVNQAKSLLQSSTYITKAYKKSLALGITQDFFAIKSLESLLQANKEAQKSLEAQLNRIDGFYKAKLATKDDVDRVQADYDTNIYNMESIKFQILSLKSSLCLKVGKNINNLNRSSFNKTEPAHYEALDEVKALVSKNSSIKYAANAVDATYYPRVTIKDNYSYYGYNREDVRLTQLGTSQLSKQNILLVTVDFRIFDYGAIKEKREAILLSSKALDSQIAYQSKEQKAKYSLAKSRIQTAEAKIKSAKSALQASSSAFVTIEKKYNAGLVDYVVYLETLTKRTNSKALFEGSLNDLEVAYATLYFYAGKHIKEELK